MRDYLEFCLAITPLVLFVICAVSFAEASHHYDKDIAICTEIDWKSPTCEAIKQERLKP